MDKKKKILTLAAIVLVGGLAALSTTGGINGLRSSYIYDGDGNIIGGDSSDDTSTVGSTGDTPVVDTTTNSEQPDEYDNKSAEELVAIVKDAYAQIDNLQPIFDELDAHITTYDQCATGIDANLDTKLAIIDGKTAEFNVAQTNLQNYKNDAKNGTLVGKNRVSITTQETERDTIIARMPAGTTVTATSTVTVNNARKAANTKLITDPKTGLNKQLSDAKKANNKSLQTSLQTQINAIISENKDIDRLNILNAQLANTYKVKAYIDLKKAFDTKKAELVALTGADNSILNDLNNQKTKRDSIPTCKSGFETWWASFKKDKFSSSGDYIISFNSLIPKAYAQTNQDGKARRDAGKARDKLRDKLKDAENKAKKAAGAIGQLANATPEFAVGVCAAGVERIGEQLGKPLNRFSDWFDRLCAGFPKQSTCGNNKVDEDEECDPSVQSSKDEDDAHYTCDSDCKWHKSV